MDKRTKKMILAIIKHCKIILETKNLFGDDYDIFKNNIIYQNAILTPVAQIGELVKKLPEDFRKTYVKFLGEILLGWET